MTDRLSFPFPDYLTGNLALIGFKISPVIYTWILHTKASWDLDTFRTQQLVDRVSNAIFLLDNVGRASFIVNLWHQLAHTNLTVVSYNSYPALITQIPTNGFNFTVNN